MKRLLIAIVICLSISSCNTGEEPRTPKEEFKTVCVDGVEYFFFSESMGYKGYGYMSPHFKRDGSLYLCEENSVSK